MKSKDRLQLIKSVEMYMLVWNKMVIDFYLISSSVAMRYNRTQKKQWNATENVCVCVYVRTLMHVCVCEIKMEAEHKGSFLGSNI